MNRKKWILAGVIMIAVVFVVIGISEWKKKYIPQPKQITQTADQSTKTDEIESVKDLIDGEYVFAPINTADWKTYRNDDMGFEMRISNLTKVNQGSFIDNSEKGISFYLTPYARMQGKKLSDIPEKDFFDSALIPFIDSGNVNVSISKKRVNNIDMDIVRYLFKKEPKNHNIEIWIEGYYIEEVFFQCKSNICSIKTFSDQRLQEKQVLFYTVLSTLHLIK